MRLRSKWLMMALVLLFAAGCGRESALVLDSFEGVLNHETVDYGSGGGAELILTADTAQKFDGAQSLRLEYDLSEGGYMWAARGYNLDVPGAANWNRPPQKIRWQNYKGFSVYMLGTNSGGKAAFDIKDSGNEMWRFMLDDDFTGWKEILMPFSEFFPRSDWQPHNADRNSQMDFPIMSFQFEPRRPAKGVYTFDFVRLFR